MIRNLLPALAVVVLSAGSASGGSEHEIRRSTLSSGGGVALGQVEHSSNSTIGQTLAGRAVGEFSIHEIWSGFWFASLVASDVPELPALDAFRLYSNHPNPFGPQTALHYSVPTGGGSVRIRLHDVAGRTVATLVNSDHAPGRHILTWDGRNENGVRVASGTYFAVMEAPGYLARTKLVVLR